MVIDTSAVLAIMLAEPEAERLANAIAGAKVRSCSAVTFLEMSIVIEARRGPNGLARLDLLVAEAGVDIVPFNSNDARSARRAYRTYGKGRHPAGLNFGDCVAYALAIDLGEPLLYKGNDFALTDVISASPSAPT